jgi:cellulose synthase (UDP-forming)
VKYSLGFDIFLERIGSQILIWKLWNSKIARSLAIVTAIFMIFMVISAPLTLVEQIIFALFSFIAILLVRTLQWGQASIVLMIVISVTVSLRYFYWRLTSSINFDNFLDGFFGWGLVLAEIYSLIVLLLGYVQTAMPLKRPVVLMPQDQSQWPTVDVFIPTYAEDLDVVRLTVLAALSLDWPKDKLCIYVLDDGRRNEFKDFCNQVGAIYLTRTNNAHNKAGNLNAALSQTNGDYVAIFDCDHIPTRSFLQISMGWFIKDPKLAMVQTPHYFFSPDPFEKNLNTYRLVPNEGELFYGLVQEGNDLWNASFFCGSCAVLKRGPLIEVGGIAIETVTEDAHTALKMSKRGYNLAYLATPQAAGLATESLSRHVVQRIRWARGMAQIFRVDNPFLAKGLTIWQRLCYSNAMLHFFYGLPRLVFLTAPLAYLLFGAQVFSASAIFVVAYALPHIAIASVTNSKIQGPYRHSFWNEVYETTLAWYILFPVLLALINPKLGAFNPTSKGGIVEKEYVDWKLSRPYILLLLINLLGFILGIVKLALNKGTVSTLIINLVWVSFNIVIISAAANAAREVKQLRTTPRVKANLAATIVMPDGKTIICETNDFSKDGVELVSNSSLRPALGQKILLSIFRGSKEVAFPGVVARTGETIGVYFNNLTLDQQKELTQITFSRADNWVNLWGKDALDSPLKSLREVMKYGIFNLAPLLKSAASDIYSSLLLRNRRKKFTS